MDGVGEGDTCTAEWTPVEADEGRPEVEPSWWQRTNWFRVAEKRELEASTIAPPSSVWRRGRGALEDVTNTTPTGAAGAVSSRLSFLHQNHECDSGAVEYGGFGDDAQLGERYTQKVSSGIGAGLVSTIDRRPAAVATATVPATSEPSSMSDVERWKAAPGGAEACCRFNLKQSRAPADAHVTTIAATPVPAAQSTSSKSTVSEANNVTTPTPIPSLLARSEPRTAEAISAKRAKSATKKLTSPKQPRIEALRGYSSEVQRAVHEYILLPLLHPSLFRSIGVTSSKGVLLSGACGVGKTHLIHRLIDHLGRSLYFQHIDSSFILTEMELDLATSRASDPMNLETHVGIQCSGAGLGDPKEIGDDILSRTFTACRKHSPALLFIDNIDVLAPRQRASASTTATGRDEASQPLFAKIRSLLRQNMDRLYEKGESVIVVAATQFPELIDPELTRPGRFDRHITLTKPDEENRMHILRQLLADVKLGDECNSVEGRELLIRTVAKRTLAFTASDLANLVTEAGIVCIRRHLRDQQRMNDADVDGVDEMMDWSDDDSGVTPVPISAPSSETLSSMRLTLHDFLHALRSTKPIAGRGATSESTTAPPVSWNDIGGSDHLKRALIESIEQPIKFPQLYARFGVASSSGVMMYGPPGCGKTLLARAIAHRCGATFLSVKGPELLSSYLGESEANIRRLFAQARACAPCVLFFDEIDAIGLARSNGPRGGGGGEATADRVLNTLLTEIETGIMTGGDEKSSEQAKKKKKNDPTETSATRAKDDDKTAKNDPTCRSCPLKSSASNSASSPSPSSKRSTGTAPPLVFIIGATNRPDLLDPALLRPGRFDALLFVGVPNAREREEILRTNLRKTPCAPDVGAAISVDNDDDDESVSDESWLTKIAVERCEGMSGADLAHVCKLATKYAIQEYLHRHSTVANASSSTSPSPLSPSDYVTRAHILRALDEVTPSISEDALFKYLRFQAYMKGQGKTVLNQYQPNKAQHESSMHDEQADMQQDGASASSSGLSASSSSVAASSSSSSSSSLASLRESMQRDIRSRLAELGENADPQDALRSILASLLHQTNKNQYHSNEKMEMDRAMDADDKPRQRRKNDTGTKRQHSDEDDLLHPTSLPVESDDDDDDDHSSVSLALDHAADIPRRPVAGGRHM